MSTIQLKESNAGEVMHLFEVMKEYNVQCSLELNMTRYSDPFIGSGPGTCLQTILKEEKRETHLL